MMTVLVVTVSVADTLTEMMMAVIIKTVTYSDDSHGDSGES